MKTYFKFLSKLIESIENEDVFLELLNNDYVFNKVYFTSEKFYKYFFEYLLPALSMANNKFKEKKIFIGTCLLVQKVR